MKDEFHRLTEYFVSEADYKEKEGVHFAYCMHKATMEENYSIEQIMNELMEEKGEENEKTPPVRYDEKMEAHISENEMVAEKKELWGPVKKLLDKRKNDKWGSWDEIHIEEEDL